MAAVIKGGATQVVPPAVPAPKLLEWPAQAQLGTELVERGETCVWLVPAGVTPPEEWSIYEDWVRVPADPIEVEARLASVAARAAAHRRIIAVDDHDLLWCDEAFVSLSPLEARLMRVLITSGSSVARASDLAAAGWPDAEPEDRPPLHTPIKTLRRKIAPVGLTIQAVSRRGYLLHVAPRPSP